MDLLNYLDMEYDVLNQTMRVCLFFDFVKIGHFRCQYFHHRKHIDAYAEIKTYAYYDYCEICDAT